MNNTQDKLVRFLISLGDDSLVLSHRLAEWCSNGPYLEEDLALSNVALDYLGRARMLYQYAAETEGKGRTEDDIAYLRNEREYTNLLIHELPINDFAFTMLRQFFLDVYYCQYLEALCRSSDKTVAAIAGKAIKESRYHLKRSEPWIKQLSQGTKESRNRITDAKIELESFIGELFLMPGWEISLVESGIAIDRRELKNSWDKYVKKVLAQSNIEITPTEVKISGGRDDIHTEFLGHMLSEMQYLQRAYPGLKW